MKLAKQFLTKNPCYTAGKKITVKGFMLHSVGCPQPRASVFMKNWNRADFRTACVHAFIDGETGIVYQTLPWNHRGWHCASGRKGSGNNTHVGVEMCEPACIRYTGGSSFTCSDKAAAREVVKRTYESAVELFAMLCKEYDLNPMADGVIISHAEGYKRGIASNHGDPEHLWRQLGMGYTMNGFRKDVKKAMEVEEETPTEEENQLYRVRKTWMDAESQKGAYKVLANAKACADQNKGYSVFDADGKVVYAPHAFQPYKVKVTVSDLNIRTGPGTHFSKTGRYTGVGVFTIVEHVVGLGSEKGWGRLKSGGWVSLDYCKKL